MMSVDYEIFVSVVEAGGLSAAARKLRISVAKVSKHLSQLEFRLGTPLLYRSTRGVTLTPDGEAFYRDISRILADVRAAERRAMKGAGVLSGSLRITVFATFGRMHLAPYLKPFVTAHPELELYLHVADGKVNFVQDRVDLAVTIMKDNDPHYTCYPLAPNRRILCAAPSYIAEHGLPRTIDDLRHHSIIAPDRSLPWELNGPEGRIVFTAKSRIQTNSTEIPQGLIAAGLGIGFRSTWSIADELRTGAIQRILPAYSGSLSLKICAFHPQNAMLSANAAAFVKFLEKLYHPVPPWEITNEATDEIINGGLDG